MKEILFRGKWLGNGEWVEGNFYESKISGCYILIPRIKVRKKDGVIIGDAFDVYKIVPETLCQYTGLKDKNDNRIWENDILKGFTYPFSSDGEFNYFATVEWSEEYKYFFLYTVKNPKSTVRGISEGNAELFENFNSNDWEAIGNIFDNPELLKGE